MFAKKWTLIFLSALFCSFGLPSGYAQMQNSWRCERGNGAWEVAQNWSLNRVPDNRDDVSIDCPSGRVTVTAGTTPSVNSLVNSDTIDLFGSLSLANINEAIINTSTGRIEILNRGSLGGIQNRITNNGTLVLNGGVDGAGLHGVITNNGTFIWHGDFDRGSLISGTFLNNPGAQLTISGTLPTSPHNLHGPLTNRGIIVHEAGFLEINGSQAGRVTNRGTYISRGGDIGGAGDLFINESEGTFRKQSGESSIFARFDNNGGTIEITGGAVTFLAGGRWTNGTYSVEEDSALLFRNGNFTFVGSVGGPVALGAGSVEVSDNATIVGEGEATLNFTEDGLRWKGGSIGRIRNAGDIVIMDVNSQPHNVVGTLRNASTIIHSSGEVRIPYPYELINDDSYFFARGTITSNGTFINNFLGRFTKILGEPATIAPLFKNRDGTINVEEGTLVFSGGGTFETGTYNLGEGGNLEFRGDTATYEFAGTFYTRSNNPIILNAGFFRGITPNAAWNVEGGGVDWERGSISALTNGGMMFIRGQGAHNIVGRFTNTGTIRHSQGNVGIQDGIVLLNDGLYHIGGDNPGIIRSGNGGIFVNTRTLRKDSNDTATIAVTYENYEAGQIEVLEGTLAIPASGTFADTRYLINSGAQLEIGSPTADYRIEGEHVGVNNGSMILNGRTYEAIGEGATWNITGNGLQIRRGNFLFNHTNEGTMSVEGGDIRFIGNFNNSGTLRTNLPVPPPGPRDDVMGTISGTLNNTGTLEVLNGTIRVTGPVTQISGTTLTAGTWNIADGATLDITSGSNIEVNNANVTLSGPDSSFQRINSLRTNGGSFALSEGRSFTTQGALTNSGTIAIDAGSQLNVTGNYTQTSKGVLALTLAGLDPTQFGRVLATGDAVLAGDLAPRLAEGFAPEVDNEFVIMTFNTPNGQFDSCSGCQLKSGLVLNRVFEPGRLKLVVVEQ